MIGFKGFNYKWMCLDKAYKVGKSYFEEVVKMCESGMHFCHFPLDVFKFYPINPCYYKQGMNKYAKVVSLDDRPEKTLERKKDKYIYDSKMVTGKMEIVSEVSISDIIDETIKYIRFNTKELIRYFNITKSGMIKYGICGNIAISKIANSLVYNEKNYGISIAGEKHSIAITSGDKSVALSKSDAIASGSGSVAITQSDMGHMSKTITNGPNSICVSLYGKTVITEPNSISVNNTKNLSLTDNNCSIGLGNKSILVTTSPHKIVSHGDNCVLVNNSTIPYSVNPPDDYTGILESDGRYSVLVGNSHKTIFRGNLGCLFVAPIYENFKIVGFDTKVVDGMDIEPNVYYIHSNNKFVKIEEDTDLNQRLLLGARM